MGRTTNWKARPRFWRSGSPDSLEDDTPARLVGPRHAGVLSDDNLIRPAAAFSQKQKTSAAVSSTAQLSGGRLAA
jgi:hypothetical protein